MICFQDYQAKIIAGDVDVALANDNVSGITLWQVLSAVLPAHFQSTPLALPSRFAFVVLFFIHTHTHALTRARALSLSECVCSNEMDHARFFSLFLCVCVRESVCVWQSLWDA